MIHGVAGLVVLLVVAWLMSENRRAFSWRLVGSGMALQVLIAVLLLKVDLSRQLFVELNAVVLAFQEATRAGTAFVFGYMGGGPSPLC